MRIACLFVITILSALSAAGQSSEWKQLFDGKDLTGWKHVGPGEMRVEDGLIQTHGGMGLLYWTGGQLGDCVIRVVYKMRDHNDNSGVFIRIPIEPREAWMPVHYGYEVQIDNEPEKSNEDEYHVTAALYSLTKPLARPGKPGPEWNTMLITLDGPRTIVVLNGVTVTDYTEGQSVPPKKFDFEPERGTRPNEGYIGLQNHSDNDIVGPNVTTARRYQDLLQNKEIAGLIAAVPDHCHKRIVVDAVRAGNDIYCEKPMSHSAADGVEMVKAGKETGRIIQIGSQRVSSVICAKAKELLAKRIIGDVTLVEGSLGRNDPTGAWEYPPPPDASPQTLDWDTWQGDVPKRAFDAKIFARWRCWKEYGTGVAGDLLVHLVSGMMHVLGWNEPPKRAMALGAILRFPDGRNMT